jgi:hypothetical protein
VWAGLDHLEIENVPEERTTLASGLVDVASVDVGAGGERPEVFATGGVEADHGILGIRLREGGRMVDDSAVVISVDDDRLTTEARSLEIRPVFVVERERVGLDSGRAWVVTVLVVLIFGSNDAVEQEVRDGCA